MHSKRHLPPAASRGRKQACRNAGGYYLWDGTDPDMQIRLGQVVSYDANGDFSIGEMTVEQISGTSYRVTLTVDEEFLENAVYPVTVDPSITVTDTETQSNCIEDIVLFEGRPDACYRTMQYNTVGASSLGTGMTAFRLTGLYESSIFHSGIMINNAKFYVHDYSSVSQTINLYPLQNTTWEENTATWNTIGDYTQNTQYGAVNVELPVGGWAEFNIYNLVDQWRMNSTVYPKESGFILVSNNNSVAKKIYSSENDTVLKRPYFVMGYTPMFAINNIEDTDVINGKEIKVLRESEVLSAEVNANYGVAVNWTSDNNQVATVDSNGVVTARLAGEATITASIVIDSQSFSDEFIVKVVLSDGFYRIINQYNNSYLSKVSASSVELKPKYIQGVSDSINEIEYNTMREVWRVSYIKDSGKYSIRPALYELSDPGVISEILAFSSESNVPCIESGFPDEVMYELNCDQWKITYGVNGYLIYDDDERMLQQLGAWADGSACLNLDIPDTISSMQHWTLTPFDGEGMVMLERQNGQWIPVHGDEDYVVVFDFTNYAVSLSDHNQKMVVYSPSMDTKPSLSWSALYSTSPYFTVDSATGYIYPVGVGLDQIKVSCVIDGKEISETFYVSIQNSIGITMDNNDTNVFAIRNYGYDSMFLGIENLNANNTTKAASLYAIESMNAKMQMALEEIDQYPGCYYITKTVNSTKYYLSCINSEIQYLSISSPGVQQRFEFLLNEDGTYTIVPSAMKSSNLAVSIWDDTDVVLEENGGSEYTKWYMIPLTTATADNISIALYSVSAEVLYDEGYEAATMMLVNAYTII